MSYNYKELQNGSDIRGVAIAEPNGPSVNLDMEAASRLALGFCVFLQQKTGKSLNSIRIAVGRDPRLSGQGLEVVICQSMASHGATVLSAGLASTPAMFMSTVFPQFACDGAIMITASHMTQNRNGMKFFTCDGGLNKEDISQIIDFAESSDLFTMLEVDKAGDDTAAAEIPAALKEAFGDIFGKPIDDSPDIGSVESIDLMDVYAAHLQNIIISKLGEDGKSDSSAKPLSGLKITVDAGNGSGGFYATKVLKPLGADISSSQFLDPDGSFPNHIPNPEDPEAMKAICDRVISAKSDLGLIFDTDVDRASAVDENGKEIAHNGIVAMAAALIAKEHPGTTVVTDSVTSRELTGYIEDNLGLKHLRYKRGYRNVISKSIELNESGIDSQLAIETSGHGAFKENYFLDDGAYLATLIVVETARLAAANQGISTVLRDLREPLESREIRLPFNEDLISKSGDTMPNKADAIIEALSQAFAPNLEEPNYEGVRINFDDPEINGWMLLRKSLHDPLMPLNMESNVAGGCKRIADAIRPILAGFPELDISKL